MPRTTQLGAPATLLLLVVACAGYENKAAPTAERYTYRVDSAMMIVDESWLQRLPESWRPVAEAANGSKTSGADRIRALNNLALFEEIKFSCRNLQTLQVARKDGGGFLGLHVTHGLIHTNPSIMEDWIVRACDQDRWYHVFGEEGYVDLYYHGYLRYHPDYHKLRPSQ